MPSRQTAEKVAIAVLGSPFPNSSSEKITHLLLDSLESKGWKTDIVELSELPSDALLLRSKSNIVDAALSSKGHIPGPLLFAANGDDFSSGNVAFSFSPRFSHTYGDARHLPSILIENHSLKPFRQRVLGTYVFMEQAILTMAKHYDAVKKAVTLDQNQAKESRPLLQSNQNYYCDLQF